MGIHLVALQARCVDALIFALSKDSCSPPRFRKLGNFSSVQVRHIACVSSSSYREIAVHPFFIDMCNRNDLKRRSSRRTKLQGNIRQPETPRQ
eukprot:c6668_g1_i1 orf=3-278(-)